jgi:hypothetical protein
MVSEAIYSLPRAAIFDGEIIRIIQTLRNEEELRPYTRTGATHLAMVGDPNPYSDRTRIAVQAQRLGVNPECPPSRGRSVSTHPTPY